MLKQAGWLEVHGKEVQEDDEASLVPVAPGEKAETRAIDVVATQTKPPARFTEATLLTAMEGAGKLVEDEELRDAMKERGLGTPATRAVIIEKLIAEEYVLRNQRELQPTPKAFSLFTLLRGLEIPELISPELTGEWEYKLKEMEHGKLSRPQFMQRHRGHDAAHRRAREGARKRHRARRLRDARDAVSRSAAASSRRTTRSSSARSATSRCGGSSRAASSSRPRSRS